MQILANGLASNKWENVSNDHPCIICGDSTWCSRTSDGCLVVCRRKPSSPIYGAGEARVDNGGNDFWFFRLSGAPAWPPPAYTVASGSGERAPVDVLHQVYSSLLERMSLSYTHRAALRGRGLADGHIDVNGYRSLGRSRATAVRGLIESGLEQHLPRVPGFVIKETDTGKAYWTLAGPPGIAIPVRSGGDQIVALMIRRDDDDVGANGAPVASGKYGYISSRKLGGPGPGSPVHVPLHSGINLDIVRVTEGTLKADVATALSGVLTIGLPGVAAWRHAAEVLNGMGAQTVWLAFDADARSNYHVAAALSKLAADLEQKNFTVELERWDINDGKGIDDLLAKQKQPEVLCGAAAFTAIKEIVDAAKAADAVAPDIDQPIEADNDPHRLATLFKRHRSNKFLGQ